MGLDPMYNAEESSYLDEQVSRLQFVVAALLEKNELLRQRLVALYGQPKAFTLGQENDHASKIVVARS